MTLAYLGQAVGTIMQFTLFKGGILPLYALHIGANNIHLGILAALPGGLNALRYVVAPWVVRSGKRRWMASVLPLVGLASLGWLVVELIYDAWGSTIAVAVLLGVTFVTMALRQIGFAAWHPLLNDIIPEPMVSLFFSRLRTIFRTSNLAVTLLLSVFMGERPPAWKFSIVFGLVSVAQFVRASLVANLPDPTGPSTSQKPSLRRHLAALRRPLQDLEFVHFCAIQSVVMLLMSAAQPLYVPYLSESRGFPSSLTVLGMAGISAGGALSLIAWGRLVRKTGPLLSFVGSSLLLTVTYATVGLVPPYEARSLFSVALATTGFIGIGIGWSGLALANTVFKFMLVPRKMSPLYMGLHYVTTSFGMLCGSLLGGWVSEATRGIELDLTNLVVDNYQIIFLGLGSLVLLTTLVVARPLTRLDVKDR